jgi:hypothetical protein
VRLALASLVLASVLPQAHGADPQPPADAAPDIRATLSYLTSRELAGRSAAEPGGILATDYLAKRLGEIGWLPSGDVTPSGRSFFQSVPATSATYDPEGSWIETSAAEGSRRIREFRVVPDRAETVDVRGSLVFAGFGIRAPEHRYDDYAGLDVRGKVVLVFSGEPTSTDPSSPWGGARATRHAIVSQKQRLAASLGAVALLVVPNPAGKAQSAADLVKGRERGMSLPWLGLADAPSPLPVLYLDPSATQPLLQGSRLDLKKASRRLEAGRPASRSLGSRTVRLRIAMRERREIVLRNVLARLGRGGEIGPAVLIGAHWDGLGTFQGALHPGADDNASGVAALLAAARALAKEPPAGEIYVAFWAAEESGMLGSRWFAEHPPLPLARIVAAVNLDMLGRNNLDRDDYANVVQLIYSAGAPALREIAREANEGIGFDLRFHGALRFQPVSDHFTFAEAGIPIVYPFSGYHGDYHGSGDTAEKVNLSRLVRSAGFVARLGRLLVERAESIRLDPAIQSPPPPDPFERPSH